MQKFDCYCTEIPGFSNLRCSILALNPEETGDVRLKAIVLIPSFLSNIVQQSLNKTNKNRESHRIHNPIMNY
jgi:hypothetical protein